MVGNSIVADFIGQKLDNRYEIRAVLGSGAMSWVFEAYDHVLEREVAVKIVKPERAFSPQSAGSFVKEACIIARLEHPHILAVYDQGVHTVRGQSIVYLVMQLAGGGTLAERISQGALPLAEAARILDQVCDALDFAHSQGVIHLDLKPANILFDEQGNALVADFGLAKLLQGASRVKADTFRGTPAYMPPEQFLGSLAGRYSDVYALGITLYEMLTGKPPTPNWTSQGFVVPLDHPLPSGVRAVIQRAVKPDPERRYRSAGEMAHALRERLWLQVETAEWIPGPAQHETDVPLTEAPKRAPRARGLPWSGRPRPLGIVLGVALLAVVAVGGWGLSGGWQQWRGQEAGEASTVPTLAPTASPTAIATPTATLTPAPTPSPEATPTATSTLTATPTSTATPTFTASPTPPNATVSAERAAIYAGPGENYDLLGEVRRGDRLPVYGRSADSEWLQVDYVGWKGWIHTGLVDLGVDLSLLPIIPAPPTPTPAPSPTQEATRVPTPTPPISLANPGFTRIEDNVIPGWDWWAREGGPEPRFAKPELKQADDPARTINGATLQIDGAGFLKFQVYVYQTVDVPAATVVRFQARAGAYADECPIKVGAGIDPDGGHNCDDARWGEQPQIDQGSGVVALTSPDVLVSEGGRVTVCLYAETLCPARSNAAFFDDAELTANSE